MHLAVDTLLSAVLIGLVIINLGGLILGRMFLPRVDWSMSMPSEIVSGQTISIDLTVHNRSSRSLEDVSLSVLPSPTLTLTKLEAARHSWSSLPAGAQQSASLPIIVIGAPPATDNLSAVLHYRYRGRSYTDLAARQYAVKRSFLTTSLDVPATVRSGQPFTATVTVRNTGPNDFSDVSLELQPPAGFSSIEGSAARSWYFPTVPTGATEQRSVTGYILLDANKRLTLSARTAVDTSVGAINQSTAAANLNVLPAPAGTDITAEPTAPETVFVAETHYRPSTGLQFGFGPLPPKVGQTTGYRLFWFLRLPAGQYTAVHVEASLPDNVTWRDHASVTAGTAISYDSTRRRVSWDIAAWPADLTVATASFDVTLVPSAADVGGRPKLLSVSTAELTTAAGQAQRLTAPTLTTRLDDAGLSGQDRVQRAD